jgi:hypothetical protein
MASSLYFSMYCFLELNFSAGCENPKFKKKIENHKDIEELQARYGQ